MTKFGERGFNQRGHLLFFAHVRDDAPRLGELGNIGNSCINTRLVDIRYDNCSSTLSRKTLAEAFPYSACTARYNDDFIFNLHAAFSFFHFNLAPQRLRMNRGTAVVEAVYVVISRRAKPPKIPEIRTIYTAFRRV